MKTEERKGEAQQKDYLENNLIIKKFLYGDIKEQYSELFNRIFPDDNKQVPSYVYVGFYKKEYVGFISVYIHNVEAVYIQYAGFEESVNKSLKAYLFKKAVERIHVEYKSIVFRVENNNTPAIKMAIFAGFKIIGVRYDGGLFVEFVKTVED